MYLPVRVSLKAITDVGKERSAKYMHSYFDKQIVVDMTENDYMYARDKKDILLAIFFSLSFVLGLPVKFIYLLIIYIIITFLLNFYLIIIHLL
jgi:hypothetical protein